MAFREVRIREVRNKLVFRFDPERDVIEVLIEGRRVEVALGDYRPLHRGLEHGTMGVNFARVAGEGHDNSD